jgi:arginyl-tRNA synthetase
MKKRANQLIERALSNAVRAGKIKAEPPASLVFEVPKDSTMGDVATPVAMGMARAERRRPLDIAADIVSEIEDPEGILAGVETAGAGYINLRFSARFWRECLDDVRERRHLPARVGDGTRVLVEFVSANPTGPLTVGHGRNAVLGDSIARLLEATGHEVTREYYFNNAGRQMMLLGESVRARCLELLGQPGEFPEGGYQGDYIVDVARTLVAQRGESLCGESDRSVFKNAAEQAIFADIRGTLQRLAIGFDNYFNEDKLYADGRIDATLRDLRERELAFDRDGAVWLRGEALGLDKDRVLVKSSGEPAYRLPDIAYHRDKLGRGYDRNVLVLGADHIAEHQEVLSALRGLGLETDSIHGIIYQFVTLTRGGVQVKMSTRRAEYVTLDELLDDVGSDVVRFFFLTRKADSHLEFDLDLAKKQSADNPVFYVQYAYARVCSIERQAASAGVDLALHGLELERLSAPEEVAVARLLAQYGDIVEEAAAALEPHRVIFYLIELAGEFHRFYNRHRVLIDDRDLAAARFHLAQAVKTVVADGLNLLGVNAPETM